MKKRKKLLAVTIALAMGLTMAGCGGGTNTGDSGTDTAAATEEGAELENLIQNGDFSDGLTNWLLYTNGGAAEQSVTEDGEMEIQVSDPGTLEHSIQPYYDGFALYEGAVYEYSFDVYATTERTLQWRLQLNGGDYHAYVSDIITVSEEVQHVTCTFTMEEETDPAPRLCINMGMIEGCPEDLGEHSVYFDNFALYLVDDSGADMSAASAETMGINVNQIGYLPDAEKQAVVRAEEGTEITGSFEVVNTETNESVYIGELESFGTNEASAEATAIADFSAVTEEGTYKLVTEEYGESYSFAIGDSVYDAVGTSALHMFYLQRCGEEIEDDTFGHAACHTDGAVIYGSTDSAAVSVSGGWHDAGDYGRYTVSGAKAAADLLLSYETYGDRYGDDTGIPESGNGVSDLLDEVQYELDWMLTMQDAETGGVYHKVTGENFPDTVMPEEETAQMILSPISTTATADFAAVMAMAADVYADVDAAYAATCLDAAQKAWAYLEQQGSDTTGFQNPDTIVTGEYADTDDMDERFWALAQLYKTTGDESYLNQMKEYELSDIGTGLGWQDVGMYGVYAYLTCGDETDAFYQTIEDYFYEQADALLEKSQADAYGVSLAEGDYCWGSNMQVANNGMLLMMADQLEANDDYRQAAVRQLDYLLGTNTTSYCFVTGYGTLSPESPHHRPSESIGQAVSGMLVGGPDEDLEDSYAQVVLADAPSAACYVDNAQSYSSNEVTIYWNSPFVYLLSGVEAE